MKAPRPLGPWHPLRPLWLLVLGLLMAALAAPCRAEASAEVRIKAAFLYKFLGFVEWPPQAFDGTGAALVIGVLGADALGDELAQAVGHRPVDGRAVVVRKLRPGDSLAGLHVAFVGRAESGRMAGIANQAREQPLLTISESDDAFAQGSVINFVVVDDKVRFDVALPRAEHAGLRISARLLGIARRVLAGTPS